MEEIDALLADESFCRNLVHGAAFNADLLHELKANGANTTDFSFDLQDTQQMEGATEFLDSLDAIMAPTNHQMGTSTSESGTGSMSDSASLNDPVARDNDAKTRLPSTIVSLLNEKPITSLYGGNFRDVSTTSNSNSNSNSQSNSETFDDHLDSADMNFDDSDEMDAELDEDEDDGYCAVNNRRMASGASARSSSNFKKAPLFQSLRSVGELKLTQLEKDTLEQENLTIHTRLPLSKQDERIIKYIRRKIRNKISAQQSRQKKRAYVGQLELQLKHTERQNRDLRAQLKRRNESLLKITEQFNSLRGFISRHLRFDMSTSLNPLHANSGIDTVDSGKLSGRQASFGLGLHPRPAVMALFLCFAVLFGCRPDAFTTTGFNFSASTNSPSSVDTFSHFVNVSDHDVDFFNNGSFSNGRCQVAMVTYTCSAAGEAFNSDHLTVEEYYFDGRSFVDRNAASMRSFKRFSDQSNVFREDYYDYFGVAYIRLAIESLLNAYRYSTARSTFRRTGEKLAAKLKCNRGQHQSSLTSESSAADDDFKSDSQLPTASPSETNAKLLDQRPAPQRTSLFKWSMNATLVAVTSWWNQVMRNYADQPCCSSYVF